MPSLPFGLPDRWLAPAPAPERVAWLRAWTYAHRGRHGPGVPENSLAAAEAAIAAGLGIECDIQRSRDDQPMVFHDWDLARLTGAEGLTEDMTAAELEALPYHDSGEHPVRLVTLLERVGGRVPLLIEIKSCRGYDVERSCRSVARLLATYRGLHAVMSFDPRVGRWFARHAPQTLRGLVVTEQDAQGRLAGLRRRRALWQAWPDFLAYDIRDLPSAFAARQRRRGLPLLAWTVRSPELLARAQAHADAAIAEGAGLG